MATFARGWDPAAAARAQTRLEFSGRYCMVASPTRKERPAVSLSHLRMNYYMQGSAGLCWVHSAKQLFEVTAKAKGHTPFPACRRAIGYAAKELYEGGGNPSDGGSPTDAISVMTSKGIGIADERLLPYTDDYTLLAQKPPDSVYEDARKTHLVSPIKLNSLAEIVRLIDSGIPVANGYPCPTTMEESRTFIDSIGSIAGGHSQLIWGYINPGVIDEYLWLEMDNWWGPIYPNLPASVASQVDGYEPVTPTMTTSAWIRGDVYTQLCASDQFAEHISATGIDGLNDGVVVPHPSFAEAFPI